MKRTIATALVTLIAGMTPAAAQTTPAPVPPPVSPAMPPAPSSTLSPILTQPGLVQRPFGRTAPAPPPAALAPIDQQKTQTYRNDLLNQQRALDRQGVSPASDQYRIIQQQLQQPNPIPR
jgi:hypothetical protein